MIVADDELIAWLGLSSMDGLAKLVQGPAENHVKDFLGWEEIEQQTWTEYHPVHESIVTTPDPEYVVNSGHSMAVPGQYFQPYVIQLRHMPARSITAFYEDMTGYFGQPAGAFAAPALISGQDYYLKTESDGISWTGHLVRRFFWFPGIPGSMKVQYVSGFTQAELSGRWSVFKTAILMTAADLYLKAKANQLGHFSNIASESDGGGVSVAYRNNSLGDVPVPDDVADMLQPYVFYGEHSL